jgi:hypothetical protein
MEKIKIICIADNKLLKDIGALYYVKYNGVYEAEIDSLQNNSYRIYFLDISGYTVNINKKYFITMAEWREQQINSILND